MTHYSPGLLRRRVTLMEGHTHRVSHAHRAHVGVGFITILVRAAAERFCAGQQLHMRLNTDDSFILQQCPQYKGTQSAASRGCRMLHASARLFQARPSRICTRRHTATALLQRSAHLLRNRWRGAGRLCRCHSCCTDMVLPVAALWHVVCAGRLLLEQPAACKLAVSLGQAGPHTRSCCCPDVLQYAVAVPQGGRID